MYYLEQKQFKPAMILFGIPFIPCIIGLVIANILLNKIELLVILSIIIGVYLIIVSILWKLSKRKNHYLLLKDHEIELEFYDSFNGKIKLEVQFEEIVRFEYYRINSIKGWLMLFSYIFPKCVYLTYNVNGEEQTKFIGYLDIRDIKEISKKTNSELKIY
ncbi:MAG: SoxR reducing system RseC family protein [Bacilli bacterium]|jgi:hypothetical protein|nr:hypothetical protein [Staphylococcus sp.]